MAMHPYAHHQFVLNEIPSLKEKTVLDCGCGKGVWTYLLRSDRNGESAWMVGLDIEKRWINHCKQYNIYNDLILAHASYLPFRNKSFDFVLASELIYYMSKKQGERFLNEIDRICKSRAVVTAPNGPWPHYCDERDRHRSTWSVTDFVSRGYRLHGLGFKLTKHVRAKLWGASFYIFTPISYFIPQIGERLIAVKFFPLNS